MKMRLVLTRAQEDSERTAIALRARGHDVLIAPLLRIEFVPADLRADWSAIVLTSPNAARAMAAHPARDQLNKLPVYAVGERSADAARVSGFTDVTTAGGDLRDLLRVVTLRRADAKKPLLYLAGEDRAGDLIGDLAAHGIAAELAVVYRAVAEPFSSDLATALRQGAVDAVLHFSRRSAEHYLAGAQKAGIVGQALTVRHLCLSAQVAEPLTCAGATSIAVADHPDEAALIALIERKQASNS